MGSGVWKKVTMLFYAKPHRIALANSYFAPWGLCVKKTKLLIAAFPLNLFMIKSFAMRTCFLKLTATLLLFFSVAFVTAQPQGKVYETKIVKSALMGKDVAYSIYLPPDYETSSRTYPVVYLLSAKRLISPNCNQPVLSSV